MLRYRLITGPILIAALLTIIWLDHRLDSMTLSGIWADLFLGNEKPPRGILLFFVGLAIAPIAGWELSRITAHDGIQTRPWLTAGAAMLGILVSYAVPEETPAITAVAIVATSLIAVFVVSMLTFSRQQNVEGVLAAAGAVVFAMVYLGFMLGFLLAMRREFSAWTVVGVIALTKTCDSGAYFTGRAIGRTKLIPWLSPGKTWEGLIGGVVASALLGLGLAAASRQWLPPSDQFSWHTGVICGAVFAVIGQFGDLTMSLLKRGAGVKDSGAILPGMGGILDVLDSPLMVAPVAFWLLQVLS